MADLELASFGLELRGTDVIFGKTFLNGTNLVVALDPSATQASVARVSARDGAVHARINQYLMEHTSEALAIGQQLLYGIPGPEAQQRRAAFHDGMLQAIGAPIRGEAVQRMDGFEVLAALYETEEVRTMPAAWGEYTGQWPAHQGMGGQSMDLAGMPPTRGAHRTRRLARAHARPRALPGPPRRRHLDDVPGRPDHRARRPCVRHSPVAGRAVPGRGNHRTHRHLEHHPGADVPAACSAQRSSAWNWVAKIKRFNYDDPQLLAVCYALKGDLEFASAAYDPAIQRCLGRLFRRRDARRVPVRP